MNASPAEFPAIPDPLRAFGARTAIVLGSGLNPLVDALEVEQTVPYPAIPGLPIPRVPGHPGQFSLARLGNLPLLVLQGRAHLYEGWSAREVTAATRLIHHLGVSRLILTNAAGSLHPDHPPGSWMMLSDHLNLTGTSPLLGGPNFIDLTHIYHPALCAQFRTTAARLNIPLPEGVYAGVPGPQFETPAEIRLLRTLGADAVGMSTVLEAIQARALGLDVLAFSCLTNWAAGITTHPLSHADVTQTGQASVPSLIALLRSTLPTLDS